MNAGDTFIDGKYHHLWIILSDPAIDSEKLIIVNLTTHTIAEKSTCVLERGEHPFIKHKTSVRYSDARVVSSTNIATLRKAKLLTPREPCSADLLNKLREGASRDVHLLPEGCRQILDEQGLI